MDTYLLHANIWQIVGARASSASADNKNNTGVLKTLPVSNRHWPLIACFGLTILDFQSAILKIGARNLEICMDPFFQPDD
jgi:hypothetical protein